MNKRIIVSGALAGIGGFVFGWLFLGMILTLILNNGSIAFFDQVHPAAQANLIGLFMAVLIFSVALGYSTKRYGIAGFAKGAVTGAAIGFPALAVLDLLLFPMVTMLSSATFDPAAILINALWAGAMGAVAGMLVAFRNAPIGNKVLFHERAV